MDRIRLALTAAVPLALASLPIAPLAADVSQADVSTEAPEAPTKGELRLAKLLEGRTAGRPTDCISARPSQKMQTIDGVAYVYGSGNTIYVQRTRNPEQISDTNALISNRRTVTQLCRLDVTRTVDRFTGQFTGAVFFEDFVPYTRVNSEG